MHTASPSGSLIIVVIDLALLNSQAKDRLSSPKHSFVKMKFLLSKAFLGLMVLGTSVGSSFAQHASNRADVSKKDVEDFEYWRGLVEGLASVAPSREPSYAPSPESEPSEPSPSPAGSPTTPPSKSLSGTAESVCEA